MLKKIKIKMKEHNTRLFIIILSSIKKLVFNL
jgi:hypothetical protein